MACTCSGPTDVCTYCDALEKWEESLSDAERGAYALRFIEGIKTVSGVVRNGPEARSPWLSKTATVEFDAEASFRYYLAAQFDRAWRAAA